MNWIKLSDKEPPVGRWTLWNAHQGLMPGRLMPSGNGAGTNLVGPSEDWSLIAPSDGVWKWLDLSEFWEETK